MTVTAKSRYAVLALVELALRTHGQTGPARLGDLAEVRGIPERYLEQLMAGLRRAGMVSGRRGAGGGFVFARPPERLTVLEVVRALDGSAEVVPFDAGGRDPDQMDGAGALWRAAGAAYDDVLAHTTIADLAERERLQRGGAPTYDI